MKINKNQYALSKLNKGDTFEWDHRHFMRVGLCSLYVNPSDEVPVLELEEGTVMPLSGGLTVTVTNLEAEIK